MTDPLLTIEEATREFRVSPKTIRRRLTAGEIVGAYKRPGSRGPEWVMPRQSLTEAGFSPRPLASAVALPTDAEARASYWERRATDAEAALRAGGDGGVATRSRRHRLGGLRWGFVGVSLVVALLAALVVLQSRSGSSPARAGTGAMGVVAALLEQETDRGDAIGLVGERRTDAVPAGRLVAPSPSAGWESPSGPRFVVATFDDDAPPPPVAALRASAVMVLRSPHGDMIVEVFDRTPRVGVETAAENREDADVGDPADSTVPSPVVEVPEADRPAASPPPARVSPPPSVRAGTSPGTDPDAGTPTSVASTAGSGSAAPGEAQVLEADSFWTIAELVVSAERGADASDDAVVAYWSVLLDANADRLVEPGNADLLHVGQTIVLPPLTSR